MNTETFTITPDMVACAKEWGHSDETIAAFDKAVWKLFDPRLPENRIANHRAYRLPRRQSRTAGSSVRDAVARVAA